MFTAVFASDAVTATRRELSPRTAWH